MGHFSPLLGKQDVVVGVGIERRVKVDEIAAFVRNFFPKDLQVVAEIKLVFPGRHFVADSDRLRLTKFRFQVLNALLGSNSPDLLFSSVTQFL